jgi:hypothetical protein
LFERFATVVGVPPATGTLRRRSWPLRLSA